MGVRTFEALLGALVLSRSSITPIAEGVGVNGGGATAALPMRRRLTGVTGGGIATVSESTWPFVVVSVTSLIPSFLERFLLVFDIAGGRSPVETAALESTACVLVDLRKDMICGRVLGEYMLAEHKVQAVERQAVNRLCITAASAMVDVAWGMLALCKPRWWRRTSIHEQPKKIVFQSVSSDAFES